MDRENNDVIMQKMEAYIARTIAWARIDPFIPVSNDSHLQKPSSFSSFSSFSLSL